MQTIEEKNEFRKKTLTRTRSSFFLVSFYTLFGIFNVLSSDIWFEGLLPLLANFIFSIGCLCVLTPIIIFSCKEIVNLSFVRKKIALFACAMVVVISTWALGLFYTINRYFILPNYPQENLDKYMQHIFFINIIINIICAFALFIGGFVVVYFCRHSKILMFKKSVFWFPILMLLVGLFFPTLYCVSINYQWTTFGILIVTSNFFDIFAYFGGSIWGKIKLIPKVSPKKTIEGVIFGFFVTIIIIFSLYSTLIYVNGPIVDKYHIMYTFLGCQFCQSNDVGTWWWWIIAIGFTTAILIVSGVGDLFFSLIKRQYKIKDFSNLLPGHGGALDRIDAISFVFSFYYFFSIVAIAIIPNNLEHIRCFWLGK